MDRPVKAAFVITGLVFSLVIMLLAALWYFFPTGKPSNIVNYKPTHFSVKAEMPFFYSIDGELKYSNAVGKKAPTLLKGQIWNYSVAPNQKLIAVVANKALYVVSGDGKIIKRVATPVSSIYKSPIPRGKVFFREDDFQWSKDSRYLYLIKDRYYPESPSQLYSKDGELWRYNVKNGTLRLVLKPFRAYSYFFGQGDRIYFSVPTPSGDLRLKEFNGKHVTNVGDINSKNIPLQDLSPNTSASIFYSYPMSDYDDVILHEQGIRLVQNRKDNLEELVINNKPILGITLGSNLKGNYYGTQMAWSAFLPGDRYFMMNVFCGNYTGQLLVDTETGEYMPLPTDTRVYITKNTDTYPRYRITADGVEAER